MKKKITTLLVNPVISGSAIMIIGTNGVNAINYLYHLIMGRLLGPGPYGELAALFSLFALVTMIPLSLGTVIVKFVSAAKSPEEGKALLLWFQRFFILLSFATTILVFIFSQSIGNFLNIYNMPLIFLVAICLGLSLLSFMYRSTLQGLLRFRDSVISMGIESALKLLLGGGLVMLGLSTQGAILGLLGAIICGLMIARYFALLSFKTVQKTTLTYKKEILHYVGPVLLYSVATTSLYSTDLLLVKHFFSSHEAGIYASISTLGKIIFYATGPVASVMFPLVSRRQSQGQSYKSVVTFSFLITLLACSSVLLLFAFLPDLTVSVSFTNKFIEGAHLLLPYGLFITFFTLSSLLINYHLSINRVKVVALPFIVALLQVLFIWQYHPSLEAVIAISLYLSLGLLVASIIYTVCVDYIKSP
jgi:O-antigen/teichoic acid export membrane protein